MPSVPAPHRSSTRRRRQRGQSLVEFALILPLMMLLILIALDVGRAFLGYVALNNATRLAANYASLHPTAWSGTDPIDLSRQAEYASLVSDDFRGMGCPAPSPVPPPAFPSGTQLGSPAVVEFECDLPLLFPGFQAFQAIFPDGALRIAAKSVFPVRGGVIVVAGGRGPTLPSISCSSDPNPATGVLPLEVNFLATPVPPTTLGEVLGWEWNFIEDDTASLLQNTTKIYSAAGTYHADRDGHHHGRDVGPVPHHDHSRGAGTDGSIPP